MSAFTAVIPSIVAKNWRTEQAPPGMELDPRPNVYAVSMTASNVRSGERAFANFVTLHHDADIVQRLALEEAKATWKQDDGWCMYESYAQIVPREVINTIVATFGGDSSQVPAQASQPPRHRMN